MAHEQAVYSMCQGYTEASGSGAGSALGPRKNRSPCLQKAARQRSYWSQSHQVILGHSHIHGFVPFHNGLSHEAPVELLATPPVSRSWNECSEVRGL